MLSLTNTLPVRLSRIKIFCPNSRRLLKYKVFNCVTFMVNKSYCSRSNTHYETLNLSTKCSSKDIREAFILLSKKYHPDKNKGNSKAQEQFVKVNEAYNVLIKPESRRDYDLTLNQYSTYKNTYNPDKNNFNDAHQHSYRDPWKDPSFARNRNFSHKNDDSYYGVKGVKKQTNDQLLFWIFILLSVGFALQIIVIRFSGFRNSQHLDRKSEENSQYLNSVRERAKMLGTRERQIEECERRINMSTQE